MSGRPRTLRAQLTAAFVALAVVPCLAVGTVAAIVGVTSLRQGVSSRNLQVARAVAGEVGRFLDAQVLSLREVAADSGARRDVERFAREASIHLGFNPALQSMVLLDRAGRARAVVPPDPDIVDMDFSAQPFVREALAQGAPTWSSAAISPRTGLPVVALVVPSDGHVVVGYVDIGQVLSSIVERTRLGPAGHAAIIDRTGVILAHPDARLVRQQVNVRDVPLVGRALASGETTAEYAFEGQRLLGSVSPVPQTDWVVLAADSAEAALGPVYRLLAFLAGAVTLAMIAAVSAGVVSARRVLRPLAELSVETRRIEAGEGAVASPPLRRAGLREIDALAESFEAMAAAVRAREADLRASEERFRMLSSLGTEGIMVHAGGVILDANEAFARMVEAATPRELIGRRGLDVLPFTPASARLVAERIRSGVDATDEIELCRRDGTVWSAETAAKDVVYAGRDARLVVMRDVSLRKELEAERSRREAQIKASEERFRLAFATSPDAMGLVRQTDGAFVEINEAFTRFTAYTAGEMLGRTAEERNLWRDPAQRASLFEALVRGERVHNTEIDIRRKDGTAGTVLLSAGRVTLDGVPHLLVIFRDITERKRSEQEREALREQLLHAQKMEAIGRLAGGVAHDFNNVLTSILACTQALGDALAAGDPRRADVEQIDSDARRAAELTRQLLSFARKQSVTPQVIRLEDRARSLERMLRRLVGAHITVEAAFAVNGWPVFVDPGQVEQVIMNLAVNARDAMPSGGRLSIRTENVTVRTTPAKPGDPPPGDYLRLEVADTGTGMTPEVRAHAFEPFFTTKGSHGTGLGLATCFSIVTQAGGTLALESAPGAGTRFRIYLPRATARAGSDEERAAVEIFGSETVLLVEDDTTLRRLAVRSLQQLGYQVIDAGSASEARAKVGRNSSALDALVMDVELPDGTGHEAASRILAGKDGVRVLFVSGSPEALGERGPGEPPVQLLPKPYAPIELARRLRLLLDGPDAA